MYYLEKGISLRKYRNSDQIQTKWILKEIHQEIADRNQGEDLQARPRTGPY